jgi:hypothetical protein
MVFEAALDNLMKEKVVHNPLPVHMLKMDVQMSTTSLPAGLLALLFLLPAPAKYAIDRINIRHHRVVGDKEKVVVFPKPLRDIIRSRIAVAIDRVDMCVRLFQRSSGYCAATADVSNGQSATAVHKERRLTSPIVDLRMKGSLEPFLARPTTVRKSVATLITLLKEHLLPMGS